MKSVGLEVKFLDSVMSEDDDAEVISRLDDSFHQGDHRAESFVAEHFVTSEINQYDSDLKTVEPQPLGGWEMAKPPSERAYNRRRASRKRARAPVPVAQPWWRRLFAWRPSPR